MTIVAAPLFGLPGLVDSPRRGGSSSRRPLGRSDLRAEAQRFEEAWDDKRQTLRDKLDELLRRVSGTREAWQELDSELANATEVSDGNDGR